MTGAARAVARKAGIHQTSMHTPPGSGYIVRCTCGWIHGQPRGLRGWWRARKARKRHEQTAPEWQEIGTAETNGGTATVYVAPAVDA